MIGLLNFIVYLRDKISDTKSQKKKSSLLIGSFFFSTYKAKNGFYFYLFKK